MKKIITAAAIAAIMGASSAAVAEWDMPFFDNDDNYYNDNNWNNDWYNDGYGYGRGDGRGRGRGKGRGSFNMNFDADADTDWEGDGSSDYYGRGYNNWDN
ncbi:sulfur globule protein CV1, partial [Solemya velum gill symbiont]